MLVDFFIVLAVYAATVFIAPMVMYVLNRRPRRRDKTVSTLDALLPEVERLLTYGRDGGSLSVAAAGSEASPLAQKAITLVKYVDAAGVYGLQCVVRAMGAHRSFMPGQSRSRDNGWPVLAAFLERRQLDFTEIKSPSDAYWTDYYHLLKIDFGRNTGAALAFVAFFFREMLEINPAAFNRKTVGIRMLDALRRRPVTDMLPRERDEPNRAKALRWPTSRRYWQESQAEQIDVYLPFVQSLAIGGLLYSLLFATAHWDALRFDIGSVGIVIPVFDIFFTTLFGVAWFGRTIVKRAERYVIPVTAILLQMMMAATHIVRVYGLRCYWYARVDGFKELSALEKRAGPGHYLHNMRWKGSTLQMVRFFLLGIAAIAVAAIVYRCFGGLARLP